MNSQQRLYSLDNLRTALIFLVVLFHSGVVYDRTGMGAGWWLVVDPSESDLPGLANLFIDILVMPAIFFISGFFAPLSLAKGTVRYLKSRLRRLILPWLLAILTLLPLFKVIFLSSRGLPQQEWTSYFHVSNGILGMSWLWFLPALFMFDCLYLALTKLKIPTGWLSVEKAVAGVFLLSVGWSVAIGALDLYGWTKTWLIDVQNEKIVPYFLVFLLGSLCRKRGALETEERKLGLYIGVAATVWIPMNLYAIVLINFFLKPGQYIISASLDRLLLWIGFHASMLALIYLAVTTFRNWIDQSGQLARRLARQSYGVYIVHAPILGLVALGLRATSMPGTVKYIVAGAGTWVLSNLVVWLWHSGRKAIRRPA
jgi:fucose 4-O-acetylase-like acetyltransferase